MTKEFIPYKQALELEELGFDEKCLSYPMSNTDASGRTWTSVLVAPLYQQAFRWFREKYGLIGYPYPNEYQQYGFRIVEVKIPENKELFYDWGTKDIYEKAELECLKKLIEIVKNK